MNPTNSFEQFVRLVMNVVLYSITVITVMLSVGSKKKLTLRLRVCHAKNNKKKTKKIELLLVFVNKITPGKKKEGFREEILLFFCF